MLVSVCYCVGVRTHQYSSVSVLYVPLGAVLRSGLLPEEMGPEPCPKGTLQELSYDLSKSTLVLFLGTLEAGISKCEV